MSIASVFAEAVGGVLKIGCSGCAFLELRYGVADGIDSFRNWLGQGNTSFPGRGTRRRRTCESRWPRGLPRQGRGERWELMFASESIEDSVDNDEATSSPHTR